jgi:hypothetical protein
MLKLLDFRAFVSHAELQERLTDLCSAPGKETPTSEGPCKPAAACEEAVGRKRVNEDPSEDATIPSKLQHSSGKDQILVTLADRESTVTPEKAVQRPPRSRSGSGEGSKKGSVGPSGCISQEEVVLRGNSSPLSSVVSAALLQTVIDVGGS